MLGGAAPVGYTQTRLKTRGLFLYDHRDEWSLANLLACSEHKDIGPELRLAVQRPKKRRCTRDTKRASRCSRNMSAAPLFVFFLCICVSESFANLWVHSRPGIHCLMSLLSFIQFLSLWKVRWQTVSGDRRMLL